MIIAVCDNIHSSSLIVTMLDSFEILTTSGLVLWSKSYTIVGPSIINGFIKEVFIEEKVQPGAGTKEEGLGLQHPSCKREKYVLKWTGVKDLGLIFVVSVGTP